MRSASPLRRGLLAAVSVPTILAALATAQPSSTGPLAPPPNGPRRADPTWVALVNATVTTRPGETLHNAAVVFRDGVITAVLPAEPGPDGKPGTEDDVPPRLPMGPRIVDCNDLFIYPAFIDPYVEVSAPQPGADAPGRHWNDYVTPQRTALDGAGLDARTAESLRKLGFAAAVISPTPGIFRGSSAVVSLAKPVSEESAAKPPVYGTHAYQSVAFDTSGRGYPGSLMGAIALIRQTLSDAQWQAENRASGRDHRAV